MERQAHLGTLRVINWILAVLLFALAGLFLLLWCIPGIVAIRDGHPIGWLFLVGGLALGALISGLGALHVKAANNVVAGRSRVLQTALAMLHLLNFPLGTAFAVYALWVCWFHQPTKVFFDVHDSRL